MKSANTYLLTYLFTQNIPQKGKLAIGNWCEKRAKKDK